jgi:hypothetical protein
MMLYHQLHASATLPLGRETQCPLNKWLCGSQSQSKHFASAQAHTQDFLLAGQMAGGGGGGVQPCGYVDNLLHVILKTIL